MKYLNQVKQIPKPTIQAQYNRSLRRFKEIESLVEASPNQHARFSDYEDEWRSLGKELSRLLNQINNYSQEEALKGFEPNLNKKSGREGEAHG